MKIIMIEDFFNPNKVWVIKRTKCRHYYLNQEICGKMFNSRFIRVTKKHIESIFAV